MLDFKSMSDDSLTDWMKTFVDKLKSYASDLGISSNEVEKVNNDYRSMSGIVVEDKKIQQSNVDPEIKREYTHYKALIKDGPEEDLQRSYPSVFTASATQVAPGVIPRVHQFIDKLKDHPGLTSDIAQKLGIAGLGAGSIGMAMGNHGQFADWLGSFISGLKDKKAELGVSDTEFESLNNDYQTTKHLVSETDTVKARTTSGGMLDKLMSYKDMIVNGPSEGLKSSFPGILGVLAAVAPGIIPRLSGLVDRFKGNPKFDELAGKDLGISTERIAEQPRERVSTYERTGSREDAFAGRRGGELRQEAAPKRNWWILPLVILLGIGLLAWGLLSKRGENNVGKAPQPKVSTPAAPGAGPSKGAAVLTPLTISNVKYTRTANGGLLTWTTNRPATSQIEIGKTTSFEMGLAPKTVKRDKGDLVTDHRVGLAGLPSAKYYIKARSMDSSGKEAVSEPYSFNVP